MSRPRRQTDSMLPAIACPIMAASIVFALAAAALMMPATGDGTGTSRDDTESPPVRQETLRTEASLLNH